LSKLIHKTTLVATAFLLMLQTVAPTWALNCLCNPSDAREDCVCEQQLVAAAPTCCANPETPATNTTNWHTVSSNTCDCYVQHSEPLLPQSRMFSELVPISFIFGFTPHNTNDQYAVAAKRNQVNAPMSVIRASRYAQIVLSVWLA